MFNNQDEDNAAFPERGAANLKQKQPPLVTVLICAAISAFMINFGLFPWFFLAPLGYAVLVCGSKKAVFIASLIINTVLSVFTNFITGNLNIGVFFELVYFSLMFLCFAWIIAGAELIKIRALFRFILSCSILALFFLIIFLFNGGDSQSVLNSMAEMLSSIMISYDPSMLQTASVENILLMLRAILLRGGAVSAFFFLFFINRQISITLFRLIKKQDKWGRLTSFYTPPYAIWVLASSFAVIIFTRILKIEILEIAAWNIFVICVMLFSAQGAGIVMHFLASRAASFRFIANILIVFLILSPLGVFAVTALILLGIAENWLPLRAAKQRPAPTPELHDRP